MQKSEKRTIDKGAHFQDYIVMKLYDEYDEGEIYSVGSKGYYENRILPRGSIQAVTSSDILIMDWECQDTKGLVRFGIECMRRDKLFDQNCVKYCTLPAHKC